MGQCNAPVFFFSQIPQFFLGIFRVPRPHAPAKKKAKDSRAGRAGPVRVQIRLVQMNHHSALFAHILNGIFAAASSVSALAAATAAAGIVGSQ